MAPSSQAAGAAPLAVLIVRLSHLGDCVRTLPLFHALRDALPEARIGWVVQRETASLLEGMPGLDAVVRFDRAGGLGAWRRLRRELAAFDPDVAIDAQGNAKSSATILLSGARTRLGWHLADCREPLPCRLVRGERAAALEEGPRTHARRAVEHLARFACARLAPDHELARPLRDDAALTATELAAGRALADELVGDSPRPVVLQLGDPADVRTLPDAGVRAALHELERRGRHVLVLAGPAELDHARALRHELGEVPRRRYHLGAMDLRALAGLLTALSERGARWLSADTGPLHLAAACGLSTVALFGPQDPARTGAWTSPLAPHATHRVVTAPIALDCRPCRRRTCAHPEPRACMNHQDPVAIVAACGGA